MDALLFVALVTFLVAYATLSTEKIDRVLTVFVGSLVLIITGVLTLNEAINYVNWETIGLLFGMFIIVLVLSDAGFFLYLAFALAKRLQYNPRNIFIVFPIIAGILAPFVNCITVMLFLAVLTIEVSKLLKIDPVPTIVAEVILANIGGVSTLIGNPSNVILGTQLGFGFNEFVVHNGPIALLTSLFSIGMLYVFNRKSLLPSAPIDVKSLAKISLDEMITNRRTLKLGLGALFVAVLLLVTQGYLERIFHIPLTVSLSALIPAFALLLAGGGDTEHVIKRLDYDVLFFFIGLFMLVGGLEKTGAITIFANGLAYVGSWESSHPTIAFAVWFRSHKCHSRRRPLCAHDELCHKRSIVRPIILEYVIVGMDSIIGDWYRRKWHAHWSLGECRCVYFIRKAWNTRWMDTVDENSDPSYCRSVIAM